MLKIPLYIITCPQRKEMLDKTITSLAASDWNAYPIIIDDYRAIEDQGLKIVNPRYRGSECYRHALCRYLQSYLPYGVICEDDVIFNIHLRHNIEFMLRVVDLSAAVMTLWNPCYDLKVSLRVKNSDAYGTQGIVFSHASASTIIKNWFHFEATDRADLCQDLRVYNSIDTVLCAPFSFVEHAGDISSIGNSAAKSYDFDINRKL